jgi:hypothetical protein
LRENNQLKFRCRAALAEKNFTGCIFSDMFFQFPAPQRLKCIATAIQGFEFGSIRPLTAQLTPLNFICCHSGILFHVFWSDFIFYWTGLTGFTGYFFGFPDESQKFQSPSANEI